MEDVKDMEDVEDVEDVEENVGVGEGRHKVEEQSQEVPGSQFDVFQWNF